jgi:hypothetical protein
LGYFKERPIAEGAEEPRIAEECMLLLGDPRFLGALGERLFLKDRDVGSMGGGS